MPSWLFYGRPRSLYYALNGSVALRGLLLESTSARIQSEADKVERVQVDAARAKVLEIAGLEIFVNDWEGAAFPVAV